MVEVICNPPENVLYTKAFGLGLNVGADCVTQPHIGADHNVQSVTGWMIRQPVCPDSPDTLHTGVAATDVLRQRNGVGAQPCTAHQGYGVGLWC